MAKCADVESPVFDVTGETRRCLHRGLPKGVPRYRRYLVVKEHPQAGSFLQVARALARQSGSDSEDECVLASVESHSKPIRVHHLNIIQVGIHVHQPLLMWVPLKKRGGSSPSHEYGNPMNSWPCPLPIRECTEHSMSTRGVSL